MHKRCSIVSCLLVILCIFSVATAFAEGPARDARFYTSGRWRIENPVSNTWVVFDGDGGYRVYVYFWADNEHEEFDDEFAMSADDPRIAVRTLETGRYAVTADGLRLEADVAAGIAPDERRPLTGDYALNSYEYLFSRYSLEGYYDNLDASVDFMPEAGAIFSHDGKSLVSMKGAKARARRAVTLGMTPGGSAGSETEFGNVEKFEEGWTVDVLASLRLDANAGSALWYFARRELYPQETFWGWAPADSLELIE